MIDFTHARSIHAAGLPLYSTYHFHSRISCNIGTPVGIPHQWPWEMMVILNTYWWGHQQREVALSIASTLEKNVIAGFLYLPSNEFKGIKFKFLQELPPQINRLEYLAVASGLSVKPKTTKKYLA